MPAALQTERTSMKNQWITRVEGAVAILLSIAVLFLLFVRATHAGGLWRDEAESVQIARMPQFTDVLQDLQYSSFPLLFSVILRTYTTLFGVSDVSLRYFGLAVGIFFLGVAWLHSRSVTREFPLLLPALIGLNANFLTAGTSVRGYGIGSVLVVLAFTLTARLLLQPSRRLLLGVFLVSLASMQCLFFNAAIVPAIFLAAATAFLVRGELKWMGQLLFTAALCGGLAYLTKLLNTYGAEDWGKVLTVPFSFTAFLHQFIAACGESHLSVSVVWLSVVLLSVMVAVWRLAMVREIKHARERDMLLFGVIALSASLLLHYALFGRINEPQERYFLALTCLVAIATDLIVANLCRYYWIRVARISLVIVAIFAMPIGIWPKITKRQTNIDILAHELEQNATQQDLIVVNPSPLGVSFNWYYHGHARWMTLPELSEKRIHRYDLLKAKMEEWDPLSDIRSAISQTLQSGNRVWLVGGARPPEKDWPMSLPPAPDSEFGWSARAYSNVWSLQLGDFLRTHALMGDVVISPANNVSEIENIPLLVARGWRD
ncbi:MAG TPA: hypothetical protein VGQ95_00965 [Chthoniobacterales bacterium]|nr:hypothetical protein [Chthoniobacterales bacterium]